MSDKKDFTPVEFAKKILEGVHNQLKKHEELLLKSKNTAHEIDPGQEPKNDDAECPPMLAEGMNADSSSEKQGSSELFKKKKKQAPEDSEMEDEDDMSEDEGEDEEEDNEKYESEENEYEFKKSESGMHAIVYKRLAKKEKGVNPPAGGWRDSGVSRQGWSQEDAKYVKNKHGEDSKLYRDTKIQNKKMNQKRHQERMGELKNIKPDLPKSEGMVPDPNPNAPTHINREEEKAGKSKPITTHQKKAGWGQTFKPGQKTTNQGQYEGIKEAKQRAAEYKKASKEKKLSKEETKETKGIHFDKPSKSDKAKEEEKGVKRPLEKCGEMKKEEHDKAKKCGDMPEMNGVKKLKKFLQKKK
jgi:hypothetical protein